MSDEGRRATAEATTGEATSEHSYTWVINIWHLVGQDEFELAPGHILRRATVGERRRIRENTKRMIPGGFFHPQWTIWEIRWPHEGWKFVPLLDENEWRYFVIAFRGSSFRTIAVIEHVFDVAPVELEVGFTFSEHQVAYYPPRLFHVVEELSPGNPDSLVDISAADAATIRTLYEKLERHDHALLDLKPTLNQLWSLKAMPHRSALRFLGYFAILEALLTHNPKPTDTIDSITRQMKQKVALLDHGWTPRLNYAPFGNAPAEKVWGTMYAYRSKLAHGAPADFASGSNEQRILGDPKRALTLLIDTVKAVVRYALEEPQLLVDLKNC
jgi:hypothetical protein